MIVGIGIDILSRDRLATSSLQESDPFRRRAFTPAELGQAAARENESEYLVGRFCAKEAVYKAVSICGIEFRPADIEVVDGIGGRPAALLLGRTRERFEAFIEGKSYELQLSISHEDFAAVAFCVAELKG